MTTSTVFEPLALSSLERYVQKDVGSDFLVSITDWQYDTPELFIQETYNFGHVSKRVPYLPKGFRVGISRIFLSFFWMRKEHSGLENSIFAYFVADGVDLIVPSDVDEIERYRTFASVPEFLLIPEDIAKREPQRSYGEREAGQIFVTSREDSKRLESDAQLHPNFIGSTDAGLALLAKPIPYRGEYFRTIKHFDLMEYGIPFGINPPSFESIVKRARNHSKEGVRRDGSRGTRVDGVEGALRTVGEARHQYQ